MIRRLLCLLFGHSRWEFDGSKPLLWFSQAPAHGTLTVGQHFCRRCHVFYGLPHTPPAPPPKGSALPKPSRKRKKR